MGKQRLIAVLSALTTLIFMPSAYASPFGTIIETISKVFYAPQLNNSFVRLNFYRFCFFIIYFTLFNLILKNIVFGKLLKNAGGGTSASRAPTIMALVFALIGAFATPDQFMGVTGELWMIVIALIGSLSIPIGLIWLGMLLKGEWWKELLGFALVMLAWALFNAIQVNFNALILGSFQTSLQLVQNIADWATIIFLIFAIVKLVRVFGGGGGKLGETASNLWNGLTGSGDDPDGGSRAPREPKTPDEKSPQRPKGFTGRLMPASPPGTNIPPTHVELWWDDNPAEQDVRTYEIFFHSKGFSWRGVTKGRRPWKSVSASAHHAKDNPFREELPADRRAILKGKTMILWIRAINARGKRSWFTRGDIVQEDNHPLVIENELAEAQQLARDYDALVGRFEALLLLVRNDIATGAAVDAARVALFNDLVMNEFNNYNARFFTVLNAVRDKSGDLGPVEVTQLRNDWFNLIQSKQKAVSLFSSLTDLIGGAP